MNNHGNLYKVLIGRKWIVGMFTFGFLSFIGVSCDIYKTKQTCSVPPTLPITDTLQAPTQNLTVDIFFDSTLSMQGFITEGSLSYYQQTISLLERPTINHGGHVNFYKFGSEIKPLADRAYRDADKKSFYLDSEINNKTLIENVLKTADNNHLIVIITDLFQEKSDIDLLSKIIKDKYIANNLAIGVMGIKSQFQGTVFDVGTNNYSFPYPTERGKTALRPFYLLAFGTHPDIAQYFNGLNNETSVFPDKNNVIFSRLLTDKLTPFSTVEITKKDNLNTSSGSIIKNPPVENNFKEFKLQSNATTALFEAKIPFKSLPESAEYTRLQPKVQGCSCQQGSPTATKSLQNNNTNAVMNNETKESNISTTLSQIGALEIKAGFKESEVFAPKKTIAIKSESAGDDKKPNEPNVNADSKNQIYLSVTAITDKFDKQLSNHCFQITLHPSDFTLPRWISDWNLTGEQVELFYKNKNFDGSRTYNLAPFLQTILESTVQTHNPKVADFYCYFKTK
ncbi:MAG: hypothetical protein IPN69_00910 [Acidobacteria bacterium]|nr:hypothetical protein [Acidobacteriota bacterium]